MSEPMRAALEQIAGVCVRHLSFGWAIAEIDRIARAALAQPDPRCETCRWWTANIYRKLGACDGVERNGMTVICPGTHRLFTAANFGCVEYEARDATT